MGAARRLLALTVNGTATLLLLAAVTAWVAPAPVPAHSKDHIPINLQVLPGDIAHDDLMTVMGDFTQALGVGCQHCHVQQADDAEDGFDYVADQMEPKLVAREMMLMTQVINDELLPLAGRADSQVTCVTCHHGQPRPRTLESVLLEKLEGEGVDAAVLEYGRLREEYYGRAVYDFGEFTLLSVARRLRKAGEDAAEQRMLELNLEHFPESYMTYSQMASGSEARGDTCAALASYAEALRLSGFSWFEKQMERLLEARGEATVE